MFTASQQLTLLNRQIKRRKYKVLIKSSGFIENILRALADSGFLRFYAITENVDELDRKAIVHLTFRKGHSIMHSLETVNRGGRKVYLSYKELFNKKKRGAYYVISTESGVYTTLSPNFEVHKKGGVCLFRIRTAPRARKK